MGNEMRRDVKKGKPAIDKDKLRAKLRGLDDTRITAGPDDYAGKVLRIVDGFVRYDREKFLSAARRAATADQRKALDATACR